MYKFLDLERHDPTGPDPTRGWTRPVVNSGRGRWAHFVASAAGVENPSYANVVASSSSSSSGDVMVSGVRAGGREITQSNTSARDASE